MARERKTKTAAPKPAKPVKAPPKPAKAPRAAPPAPYEKLPTEERARLTGTLQDFLRKAVRTEDASGNARELSEDEIGAVTAGSIEELIDEECPDFARSTAPLNEKRPDPVPFFARARDAGRVNKLELAENVLELISIAHALMVDPIGRDWPLEHEIDAVSGLNEVVLKYRSSHEKAQLERRQVEVTNELATIYRMVASAWPPGSTGTGEEKLGAARSLEQDAVIDDEKMSIQELLDKAFEDQSEVWRATHLDALAVDGIYIRKHDGPVQLAAVHIGKIFGVHERTILARRTVPRIELTRLQTTKSGALVPPVDLWPGYKGKASGGEAALDSMMRSLGTFTMTLLEQVALERAHAPSRADLARLRRERRARPRSTARPPLPTRQEAACDMCRSVGPSFAHDIEGRVMWFCEKHDPTPRRMAKKSIEPILAVVAIDDAQIETRLLWDDTELFEDIVGASVTTKPVSIPSVGVPLVVVVREHDADLAVTNRLAGLTIRGSLIVKPAQGDARLSAVDAAAISAAIRSSTARAMRD